MRNPWSPPEGNPPSTSADQGSVPAQIDKLPGVEVKQACWHLAFANVWLTAGAELETGEECKLGGNWGNIWSLLSFHRFLGAELSLLSCTCGRGRTISHSVCDLAAWDTHSFNFDFQNNSSNSSSTSSWKVDLQGQGKEQQQEFLLTKTARVVQPSRVPNT